MTKLFLAELRRSLRDNVAFVGMLWLALVAIQKSLSMRQQGLAGDISSIADLLLFFVLVLSVYYHGTATFPEEFRERLWILLFSIPRSRTVVWLTLMSARGAGVCCGLVLAAGLRPSLIDRLKENGVLWLALYSLPFLFAAGAAASLLSRLRIFIYGPGLLLTLFLFFELTVSTTHLSRNSFELPLATLFENGDYQSPLREFALEPGLLFLHLCLWIGTALWLSWRVFVDGQYSHQQTRSRSVILTALASIALVALVASEVLPRTYGRIFESPDLQFHHAQLSATREYIATFTVKRRFRRSVDIDVYSVETGEKIWSDVIRGAFNLRWSKTNNSFYTLSERNQFMERVGLSRPIGALWSFSLDGSGTLLREGVRCFEPTPNGKIFTVSDSTAGTQGEWIDERTFHSSTIPASLPVLADFPEVSEIVNFYPFMSKSTGEGVILGQSFFPFTENGGRPLSLPDQNILVRAHGKLETREAIPYWLKQFGTPTADGTDLQGAYIHPSFETGIFDESATPLFFFVREPKRRLASIFAYDRQISGWVLLVQDVPMRSESAGLNTDSVKTLTMRPYRSIGHYYSIFSESLDVFPSSEGLTLRVCSSEGDKVLHFRSANEEALLATGTELALSSVWDLENVVTVRHRGEDDCRIDFFNLQQGFPPRVTASVTCEENKKLGYMLSLKSDGVQIWTLGEFGTGFAVLDRDGNLIRQTRYD